MQWQGRSVRKPSGGRYHTSQGKKRSEIGRAPAETHIGEDRKKVVRTYGGNQKVRALRVDYATVANPATGETRKAKIETVEANSANPNYVRRNLLTRGAIIRTEMGRARIVSRPSQDGVVNAVLIA
ncbi:MULTISPECIES: 30S ribosomal protein S8e [unclassified Methanoculleus]|jgi:small subunit ribosomal protein S8e|uniref:Small ribosomal subunit protein eS8 n=1 Tax=Methanoculleus palmolei TaxID=72612 RepID=A0ABD8A6R1_9EURY|nr:30S ribosomal protein S8e [Methanoculleus sp. UBA377]MDD2473175.1 30S ribosomal protein S8e [Methanoculleus sp.]WOX55162.1 30S ribosomal protein S8e [Methanoculleus palmolei]